MGIEMAGPNRIVRASFVGGWAAALVMGLTACSETTYDYHLYQQLQASSSPTALESAASFLGAATGKEAPVSIDTVVFLNSVLGINQVPDSPLDLYGDLWVLERDDIGAPILDASGCVQPIASEPIEWPDGITRETVPMVLEEFMDGEYKCSVVPGYETYTVELEIGRLNMVRTMASNPTVFARALEEAINTINAADQVTTDAAGRLVLITYIGGVREEHTIDSPRENIALYVALMKEGRIAGYGPERMSGGSVIPPEWLEISTSLNLGDLAFLRDGDYRVRVIGGYADLSDMRYSRRDRFENRIVEYIGYVAGAACLYQEMQDDAWTRIFDEEASDGGGIDGFTKHVDDTRRTIVFMHDVIQDVPEAPLATLPTPAGNRIGTTMAAAAAFLGGASNKGVELTVDGLVFLNTVLGLNDVDFTYKGEIYGDLWQLLRNEFGEPLLDANGCPQPISSQGGIVPMELDENFECVIVEGFEDDVIEVELGRLNGARVALTNPQALDRALFDAINTINGSLGLKMDLAGRLAYTVDDGGTLVDKTIDSPRAGLALYTALMRWGKLEGTVEIMQEGDWVTVPVSVTLGDDVLDAEELGYLKHGDPGCQADPAACGARLRPSGYVDYEGFTHNSFDVYGGVDVSFVERQDDPSCGYVDRTEPLWEWVLGSDDTDYAEIEAAVQQAEDTRTIIQFTHTVIQDPEV